MRQITAMGAAGASRWSPRRLAGVALPARRHRSHQLSGVHPRRRRSRDGLDDVRVDAAARRGSGGDAAGALAVPAADVGVQLASASAGSRRGHSLRSRRRPAGTSRTMVAAAGGKNVWIVGGGELAGQFYDHGLLDELFVQVGSVTLGAGKPLLPRAITSVRRCDCCRRERSGRGSPSCTTRSREGADGPGQADSIFSMTPRLAASSSAIFEASLPPASAKSGRPPPPPPTIGASCLTT